MIDGEVSAKKKRAAVSGEQCRRDGCMLKKKSAEKKRKRERVTDRFWNDRGMPTYLQACTILRRPPYGLKGRLIAGEENRRHSGRQESPVGTRGCTSTYRAVCGVT